MKKQNNFAVGLTVAILAGFASSGALAGPQVLTNDKIKFADGPGAYPGGAFILTAYNSTGTIAKGSFQSFCLEKNEYMNYGGPAYGTGPTFNVTSISTEAQNGGAGGRITTIAKPYSHDPLDVKTAYLYTMYMETPSVLSSSVAGWSSAGATDRGSAMQLAVWKLEQEISSYSLSGYSTAAQALAANLYSFASATSWTDTGRVKVLNLTWFSGGGTSYPTGTYAQDQLYIAPVPEPETYAMLLAGLGLIGVIARRRRKLL